MNMKVKSPGRVLSAVHRLGAFQAVSRWLPSHLTAIVYHRVADPVKSDFNGDPDLVSALPAAFARQLDYLASNYMPIDEQVLIDWLDGRGGLPERPLLVTFDDGYRDNLLNAASELKARGIPALLFVTTRFA